MFKSTLRGAAIGLGFAAALTTTSVLAAAMGTHQARHLLARTGFQPTPEEVAIFERLDYADGHSSLHLSAVPIFTLIPLIPIEAVAEEMPEAYKNIHLVVDAIERAGISRKVARLRPVGVVKG